MAPWAAPTTETAQAWSARYFRGMAPKRRRRKDTASTKLKTRKARREIRRMGTSGSETSD